MAGLTISRQMLDIAIEVRAEATAGAAAAGMNAYNNFRRLLKERGLTVAPKMAAELYRRAVPGGFEAPLQEAEKKDEEIPEEEEDQPEDGEEEEEAEDEEVDPEGQDYESPGPGKDGLDEEGEQEDEGETVESLMKDFFTPILETETLDDFEERILQGIALGKESDRHRLDTIAMDLIAQAHFHLSVVRLGLDAPQVRVHIKSLSKKVRETDVAFAKRYLAATRVYVRIAERSLDDSLRTKGRRLFEAAGLGVPKEFEGPDVSLSSGHTGREETERQTPSPPRPKTFNIRTPDGEEQVPPFPFRAPRREDFDGASVSPSQAPSELVALVAEMKAAREQQAAEAKAAREEARLAAEAAAELRKQELQILADKKSSTSIFQVKPQADFPKFGDKDHDVESHMENFEDLCTLANPNGGVSDAERLRLFGQTLEGTRARCYRSAVKEAKKDGTIVTDPKGVLADIVAQLYADFHETDEARTLKAKKRFDNLEKGRDTYQTFATAWSEALADLKAAKISKPEKELFYDFILKIGPSLKTRIL